MKARCPVRIGNNAASQLQLDIYGELLDGVYLSNKYGDAISHRGWLAVNRIVDYVCKNWSVPDAGIWEVRNEPREHLHSRLMCWVAVDRAIRLASKRSLAAPFGDWVKARNEIGESIYRDFWNQDLGYFVRAKGETAVDGAMLLMPLVRFIGATDPAWLATLDAIRDQLTDDGLVLRYKIMDGLDGKEGSFAACAFWYVECLARAGRACKRPKAASRSFWRTATIFSFTPRNSILEPSSSAIFRKPSPTLRSSARPSIWTWP